MLKQAHEVEKGVAWLKGDRLRKALLVHTRAVSGHPDSLSFFAPDFSLHSSAPWFVGEEIKEDEQAEALESPHLRLPPLVSKIEASSADFTRTFEDIVERIHNGEFEKVVPIVREEYEFSAPLERRMFVAKVSSGQFSYGFQFEGEGLAGLTPEVLFSVEDGLLQTMALAGTGRADGPSLLSDAKEMHEHRLVIDHIVNELKSFGEVSIGKTTERAYGILKHLHTPLEIRLNAMPRFETLVARLHPTAALGGWPRQPAVAWLEKQFFHQSRGRFGAPFGYRHGQSMMCVVAIRNVQWKGTRLQVSSGCGVVKGSQVLKEWQELELKRQSVFRALEVDL